MNLSRTLRRGLSITALMAAFLFLAACGTESTPTPTPTPAPDVNEVLSKAGEKMAAMSSVKFGMVDEKESGAKFFDTTFKSMEGEVEAPESFKMVVKVVAPAFGFVEIEMMAIGEEAYIKFSEDAPWAPLPLDQVPFNFAGMGATLRDLFSTIEEAAITGRESVQGAQTVRVEGNIASEGLADLITSVDPGHAVVLTLWIDEAEHTLRQMRIAGRIYDDDGPETTRLLNIHGIDVPVDIRLPDIAGQ